MDDVEAILAGDIFQRHVLLGPRTAAAPARCSTGSPASVVRNGKDVAVPADLEAGTGRILDTVRHVADVAAALGDRLRAGQFIICGAITRPLFLEPGDTASTSRWLRSARCRCGLLVR